MTQREMKQQKVIYIGGIVVETESLLIAAKVAEKAAESNNVRGIIAMKGESYRWSTNQQYEHHGGFTTWG